ncbi:MAG: phospholipase D family protein [Gammaproteobacteria bacterium]|nr:phospholipase D family protein [Gammaproteobacteria bacterium]
MNIGRLGVVVLGAAFIVSCVPIKTTDKQSSTAFDDSSSTRLYRAAQSMAAGHGGKSGILLLDRGRDALAWRTILADASEQSIDAQYFLWKDDDVGKILIQRLLDAAARGVRVRVLIDDSMTESNPQYLALFGAYPNVEVRLYKPFGSTHGSFVLRWLDFATDFHRLNRRMHNKLFLVDGSFAIIGGRNIGDDYFDYPVPYVFRDRDLLALGPVAESAADEFDVYWNSDWAVPIEMTVTPRPSTAAAYAEKESLDEFAADPEHYPAGFYGDPSNVDAEIAKLADQLIWGEARLLFDAVPGPEGKPQPHPLAGRIDVELRRIVEQSTEELLVESAYLILADGAFPILDEMGKRGIKTRFVTNSMASNNHLSAFEGYRKQRKAILGVTNARMFEIRPDFKSQRELFTASELEQHEMQFGLHAKTSVFDRKFVFVGSFNVDPRSRNLNTEMGLLVESEELGRLVAESIERDMAAGNSWEVVLTDAGKFRWLTHENGMVMETLDKEPMTTAVQRAEARALGIVPAGQL